MSPLNLLMTALLGASVLAPATANASGSSGFEFNDLYVEGAVVAGVYGPGDDGFRTLSVKVLSVPDGRGHIPNMVGIVDITDRGAPYGPQMFPMDQRDGERFSLHSGGRNYYFIVTQERGESRVVIKRPGSSDGGGGVVTTSMEELAMLRLDQIAQRATIDIGGRQYYVLGQGGLKGSLIFFSKDEVDGRRASREPQFIEPVAMAAVSEFVAGRTRRVRGNPDMGRIDGVAYHLEFDEYRGSWRVVQGVGD